MNAQSSSPHSIAFAGGGNMAEAIIAGLVSKNICDPSRIMACDSVPERRDVLRQHYGIQVTADLTELPAFSTTLLLAVKPKNLPDVGGTLRELLHTEHLVISILAGQSLARLTAALGEKPGLVRVMPNLCAQVGAGISGISFAPGIEESKRQWVRDILTAVGQVVEIEEELQDAVTAVSGSGPGYIFYLAGHFIAAAQAVGFSPVIARSLVVETLYGSARVLQERDDDCMELVRRVATPGGTTEAGLSALQEHQLPKILAEMVQRATNRSKELDKG